MRWKLKKKLETLYETLYVFFPSKFFDADIQNIIIYECVELLYLCLLVLLFPEICAIMCIHKRLHKCTVSSTDTLEFSVPHTYVDQIHVYIFIYFLYIDVHLFILLLLNEFKVIYSILILSLVYIACVFLLYL